MPLNISSTMGLYINSLPLEQQEIHWTVMSTMLPSEQEAYLMLIEEQGKERLEIVTNNERLSEEVERAKEHRFKLFQVAKTSFDQDVSSPSESSTEELFTTSNTSSISSVPSLKAYDCNTTGDNNMEAPDLARDQMSSTESTLFSDVSMLYRQSTLSQVSEITLSDPVTLADIPTGPKRTNAHTHHKSSSSVSNDSAITRVPSDSQEKAPTEWVSKTPSQRRKFKRKLSSLFKKRKEKLDM